MIDFDIAGYADDNTPYVSGANINAVVQSLEKASELIFKWLSDNQMKGNVDKCHILLSTNDIVHVNIGTAQISNSNCEKLLGINIDSKLNFERHIGDLCKKASAKLNALARVSHFMTLDKKRLLMNAFFTSQFSYCPLIWMLHSRKLNNKINRLHERCLRTVYSDKLSCYEELLDRDNSVSIHYKNIQKLATEMYRVHKGIAPEIIRDIFPINKSPGYNLRHIQEFSSRTIRTVHYGTDSLSFLGPKIWDLVPTEIKCLESTEAFRSAIKCWKPENCPCRICRKYIHHVGFL